jgi:hypothetical protein
LILTFIHRVLQVRNHSELVRCDAALTPLTLTHFVLAFIHRVLQVRNHSELVRCDAAAGVRNGALALLGSLLAYDSNNGGGG